MHHVDLWRAPTQIEPTLELLPRRTHAEEVYHLATSQA